MESNKDDLKTQFVTQEGCFRLLNLSEYSRPNRAGYQSNQNSPQVRVSFVSLPQNLTQISAEPQQQQSLEKGKKKSPSYDLTDRTFTLETSRFLGVSTVNNNINGNNNVGATSNEPIPTSNTLSSSTTTATVTSLPNELQQEHNCLNQNNVPSGDWICFNFGKELYTYSYRGVKKVRGRSDSGRVNRATMMIASVHSDNNSWLSKGGVSSLHQANQTFRGHLITLIKFPVTTKAKQQAFHLRMSATLKLKSATLIDKLVRQVTIETG